MKCCMDGAHPPYLMKRCMDGAHPPYLCTYLLGGFVQYHACTTCKIKPSYTRRETVLKFIVTHVHTHTIVASGPMPVSVSLRSRSLQFLPEAKWKYPTCQTR